MANALIPNQNILNRRGYSDEGIDLSLYQDRTGYGLAQLDPYGRVQIGGDPGLQEYLNYLAAPQTREVMGNVLADTIPVSAQGQAIERLKQQYTALQNAQSPIQAAVRAADIGLEGGALVADVLPYGKAAVTGLGALGALMSRKGVPEGIARAPQAANQLGMTGWHGSPHKFDRFDHSNMGSGEGAQAYGWGTYIAEDPAVAGTYKGMGRAHDWDPVDGYSALEDQLSQRMMKMQDAGRYDEAGAIEELLINRDVDRARARFMDSPAAIEEINRYEGQFIPSNLYSVDLPDEKIAQMLDWDAPLSEQSDEIASDLSHIVGEEMERLGLNPATDIKQLHKRHPNGASLYRALINQKGGKAQASEFLRGRGIPGIKYFDGNSRGAGQGTRNFVVFDENDMKILTRNGEEIAQSADSLPMDEASRMARAKGDSFSYGGFDFVLPKADKGREIVMVPADKMESLWADVSKVGPAPKHDNQIKTRIADFNNWLDRQGTTVTTPSGGQLNYPKEAIELPRVVYLEDKGVIDFSNGRHRTRALMERGLDQIPVSVDKSEAAALRKALNK